MAKAKAAKTDAVDEKALIQAASTLTPAMMVEKALASGAGIDVLERLLALQERWEAGLAKKAYNNAMAEMRAKLPKIVKDRSVDYSTTHYKHEDLGDMVGLLNPVASEHGLSFSWRTDNPTPTTVKVTCIVTHRDGHFEETSLIGPNDTSGGKNAIQGIGSSTSYLERYTLKAILGMASSHDDDGNGGNGGNGQQQSPPEQRPAAGNQVPKQEQTKQQEPKRYASTPDHDALWTLVMETAKAHGSDPATLLEQLTTYTDGRDVANGVAGATIKAVPGVKDVLLLHHGQAKAALEKLKGWIAKRAEKDKDWRKLLSDAVIAYCLKHKDDKPEPADKFIVLKDLTGQTDMKFVTQDMAKVGMEKFAKEYQN